MESSTELDESQQISINDFLGQRIEERRMSKEIVLNCDLKAGTFEQFTRVISTTVSNRHQGN